ncbi:MAG: carbohydrate ABC transporter permease [Ardenticatenia bacterium]|jgi:ABC-type glycerol-3-phosphate transport system permease component|nr:MAG: carbohydrate ABC transporter permease [Ardenticatenia bacterium]
MSVREMRATLEEVHSATRVSVSRRRFDWSVIIKQLVLLLAAFTVLFPAYFMVITPLKTQEAYSLSKLGFPTQIYLGNFETALRGGRFFLWFGNSIILSVGAVALSTLVAAMGAFATSRMNFRGRNLLLSLISSLMVIPPVVMLIPLFLLLTRIKMTSTYPGAILVYAGLLAPFSVYLLNNFFRTIPHEIIESALMDGASPLDILFRIMLPLSAPALMTLITVNMLWVWNDLLIALVLLPEDSMRTLMVGITVFGSRYNADVPVSMAGMLMASVPIFLIYLFGQRYFIRGLVAGAIKG